MPSLYVLIDQTSTQGMRLLAVADLKRVQAIGAIQKANGREVIAPPFDGGRTFSKFDLQRLQYLYWNTFNLTPPDVYQDLIQAIVKGVEAMPVDQTPIDDLEAMVKKLYPDGNYIGAANSVETQEKASEMTTGRKAAKASGDTSGAAKTPRGSGTTARVWEIATQCFAEAGGNVSSAEEWKALRATIMANCEAENINKATAATQYSKWKASKN